MIERCPAWVFPAVSTRRGGPRSANAARPLAAALLLVGLTVLTVACSKQPRVRWIPAMEAWFGDELALRTDPPRRYWNAADEDLLLRRLGHTQVAAVGRIVRIVRTDRFQIPERVVLVFVPHEVLHSQFAPEQWVDAELELAMPLGPPARDFERALSEHRRLLREPYLLLLSQRPVPQPRREQMRGWERSLWPEPPPFPPEPRWALYRVEADLIDNLRTLYRSLARQ